MMGEARRKKQVQARGKWPSESSFRGLVELHMLPPVPEINGARIRELTGDAFIPEDAQIAFNAFRAVVGERIFHVGFCLGDGARFSAVGIGIIERLSMESPDAALHVVPVRYGDIAWDIVLRHLRTFGSKILLFAFPDSDIYDAGTAEIFYSKFIRVFDPEGTECKKLTKSHRIQISAKAALVENRRFTPFYEANGTEQEDVPWVFRFVTPAGKVIHIGVWNGRRGYAHEFPKEILHWVGGDKIAIVQVEKPVGVNGRSSLKLTHALAEQFDGVIHWARDTETFDSILRSFIRLDLESVAPPKLPEDWAPQVLIMSVGGLAGRRVTPGF